VRVQERGITEPSAVAPDAEINGSSLDFQSMGFLVPTYPHISPSDFGVWSLLAGIYLSQLILGSGATALGSVMNVQERGQARLPDLEIR
jgi:hypothetical protein